LLAQDLLQHSLPSPAKIKIPQIKQGWDFRLSLLKQAEEQYTSPDLDFNLA
jgi:hypothetical protein